MRDNYVLERIEQLCERKKLSHYRLARKSGIHQSSLSVLLNRNSTPNIYTLERICTGLDISLAQFFSKDGEYVDLTDSQKYLLSVWNSDPEIDKKLILAYFDGIKEKNKI